MTSGRRPKYPYCQVWLDSRGKWHCYYRRAGYALARLPLPEDPGFLEAYLGAHRRSLPVEIGADRTEPGTAADVVVRYLKSAAFVALAPSSQRKIRNMAEHFRNAYGDRRIRQLEPEHLKNFLSKRRPCAQRNWLRFLRALLSCALDNKLIATDPSVGVKILKAKNSGGFPTWPPEAIEQYR